MGWGMMNVWHRKGPVQIGVLQDSLCGRCFVALEFYTKSTETARTVRMLCTIEQSMHEYPIQ